MKLLAINFVICVCPSAWLVADGWWLVAGGWGGAGGWWLVAGLQRS